MANITAMTITASITTIWNLTSTVTATSTIIESTIEPSFTVIPTNTIPTVIF